MSKYEISRRMLAQNPKILEALEEIKRQHEERLGPAWRHKYEDAKTDEERGDILSSGLLKKPQQLMILHITGNLDWDERGYQVIQIPSYSHRFTQEDIGHLRGYLKNQKEINSVIGRDHPHLHPHLIELIVFVIQGPRGCSISNFYQNLFLKIRDLPQNQWSNIINRVIQDIRRGKTRGKRGFSLEFSLKNIIEDLGLKQPN